MVFMERRGQNVETLAERIADAGYEDVVIFSDYDYETAFIGISSDNRAVYDYDLMIEYLIDKGMTEDEAIEWIDYNTVRALPYVPDSPIILYKL